MRKFPYGSQLQTVYQRRHGFVPYDGMHVEVRVVEVREPVSGHGKSNLWFTPAQIEWAP